MVPEATAQLHRLGFETVGGVVDVKNAYPSNEQSVHKRARIVELTASGLISGDKCLFSFPLQWVWVA